ncbi:MAG TPA: pseudouridine synthase [Clostridiales bacterium]|nr:pseudouridine synthase [Clostridiales bacterium]HQP68986.1 pseudouridine synthase [Clostridiales bacterium]
MAELIRLQKYLADKGVASRRKCEKFITDGLVKVNGKVVTELGTKVDPDKDIVEVNEQEIKAIKSDYIYIMLNKPAGYITSLKQTDSSSPLVTDLLKKVKERVYPVGRLDKDSSGLLLLTNDGDFAYKLMHPSFEKEKEYIVTTMETVTRTMIERFQKGIMIEGVKTQPAIVKRIELTKISIILKEGRNRQIRKMLQKVGNTVSYLRRVRINNLTIGNLKEGEYRFLTKAEVKDLVE